ncbi:hypothetical protein PQX77_021082 [Marasmius sp. AFHP31]|nr:hypothetical protein PQX77_021082 [Marasmius sp. AFHP31]
MNRLLSFLQLLLLLTQMAYGQSTQDESSKYVRPLGDLNFYNGRSDAAVTFDQHSILLDGKRHLLFSGEFHPVRLPAPELWRDILQKFKVGSFMFESRSHVNTYVSTSLGWWIQWRVHLPSGIRCVVHWGLTSPNKDTIEFTHHNNIAAFLEVAKEVGVLVILRPGITKFSEEAAPYQYPDGPLIAVQGENEYYSSENPPSLNIPGLNQHMQEIHDVFRERGLTKIPTIHNDKNAAGIYAGVGGDNNDPNGGKGTERSREGKVDLYGWDGYPLGFDCDKPETWTELSTQHDASHQKFNPAEPLALFEWQGGAFSYWSGPGYEMCYKLINEQFANVYYKNNYAAGTALQNLYMTYGGTNWGNLHTHTIYSSYDYGAAVSEDRLLTLKYHEIKLQAYFLHATPSYKPTFSTPPLHGLHTDSSETYVTHLHSPQDGTNFYFVRQSTNQKTTETLFKLTVNVTDIGEVEISDVSLKGRESKVLVSNYAFGKESVLEYASAEILTWGTYDEVDTIVLYAFRGQHVEISVKVDGKTEIDSVGSTTLTADASDNSSIKISGETSGLSIFTFGNKKVVVTDKETAYGFWAPRLSTSTLNGQYDLTPNVPSVLLTGPYLVREASIKEENMTLNLVGDVNGTETETVIEIYAPTSFESVTWNGQTLSVEKTEFGTLKAVITPPSELADVEIPTLSELEWACTDSLPELQPSFDDSTGEWVVADKTETRRPQKPLAGKNVLYGPEYGFHAGDWIFRGHFTGKATGVELSVQGGFSFAFSAWLNGHFLGSDQGSSHSQDGIDLLNATFTFSPELLRDGDNVITVIHDSTGGNQDYNVNDEHKTPRGIRGYKLLSSDDDLDFTEWKVAGTQSCLGTGIMSSPSFTTKLVGTRIVRSLWYLDLRILKGNWALDNVNDEHKTPQGIRGYKLLSSDDDLDFTEWKVAGNIGQEDAPDKVRGPYNEGGWWFEREGAHLPGYDASSWNQSCSPLTGISAPGVTVYRTIFNLDFPANLDIPLSFEFSLTNNTENRYRSLLFVNGWQFGRFISSLGPQTSYPVPEGILNHHGRNEILVTLWALDEGGAKFDKLELRKRGTLVSSKKAEVTSVEAPRWDELRGGK